MNKILVVCTEGWATWQPNLIMDDLLLLNNLLVSQNLLMADEESEARDRLRLLTATLIIRSNEDHMWVVRNRRRCRQYLARPNLLPNPRVDTPWRRLYRNGEDRAFITTMGVDTTTFRMILEAGFGLMWYTLPITRPDTHTTGRPRAGRRSLDAEGGLGLVLHWLSSTMRQVSLQQIFALVPSTVSRYLQFALSILLMVLQRMPHTAIAWPQGDDFLELSGYVAARHPLLHGVFGSIDGLNLPCQVSSDIEMENATYNGWLHDHFISSVIVFSSKGACHANFQSTRNSPLAQGRSSPAVPTVQAVGTIHGLLRVSTKNSSRKHLTGFVWSQTQHSPRVMIASLERSVLLSRPASLSQRIPFNGNVYSISPDQFFRIVKPSSGACANSRVRSEGFEYLWELRTWRSGLISLRRVSAFTIFVHIWSVSTTSKMCMCLYGAKGLVIESGKGSRGSCSLINGSMIELALSTSKRNGTEGPTLFSIP